jgi:hypothetical protein
MATTMSPKQVKITSQEPVDGSPDSKGQSGFRRRNAGILVLDNFGQLIEENVKSLTRGMSACFMIPSCDDQLLTTVDDKLGRRRRRGQHFYLTIYIKCRVRSLILKHVYKLWINQVKTHSSPVLEILREAHREASVNAISMSCAGHHMAGAESLYFAGLNKHCKFLNTPNLSKSDVSVFDRGTKQAKRWIELAPTHGHFASLRGERNAPQQSGLSVIGCVPHRKTDLTPHNFGA